MITRNTTTNNVNQPNGHVFYNIPLGFMVFVILCFIYLSFVPNGNEENYLQLAKQFYSPNWIVNSEIFNEFPGTRLLYQYIFGFILSYLSFESTVFVFRLILIILFSVVLSKIYTLFKFNQVMVLFHLAILFIGHQSLFAGSWMMITVEPKGIAYFFVLLGIYMLLLKKMWSFTILLIIATYFHILVGLYSFSYLTLTMFIFKKENETPIKLLSSTLFIYCLAVIPNIIYLKSSILTNDIPIQPSADWIYTYFRSPQHTALFKNLNFFYHKHFYGIFLSAIGLYFAIKVYKQQNDKLVKLLTLFVIVSLSGTLLLIIIAFIDKTGFILKYYLYRINTLSTFFLMFISVIWIWKSFDFQKSNIINKLVFLFSLFFVLKLFIPNIVRNYNYLSKKDDVSEICQYIKNNSTKNSRIFSFVEDLTITRKCQRDRFVVRKFVPAQLSKIHYWYSKILVKKQIKNNSLLLKNLDVKYIITYKNELNNKKFVQVFQTKEYRLYEVK